MVKIINDREVWFIKFYNNSKVVFKVPYYKWVENIGIEPKYSNVINRRKVKFDGKAFLIREKSDCGLTMDYNLYLPINDYDFNISYSKENKDEIMTIQSNEFNLNTNMKIN